MRNGSDAGGGDFYDVAGGGGGGGGVYDDDDADHENGNVFFFYGDVFDGESDGRDRERNVSAPMSLVSPAVEN